MNATELMEYRKKYIPVFNNNAMKLGVFGTNCSNGCTITHAETTFKPTYQHEDSAARRILTVTAWKSTRGRRRWRHKQKTS